MFMVLINKINKIYNYCMYQFEIATVCVDVK